MKMPLCLAWFLVAGALQAAPSYLNLPTVLKLAGAGNDEIEFAKARHKLALAEADQTSDRFWPLLNLGVQYRGHEGQLQDVVGNLLELRKQQYSAGGNIQLEWAPGDTYYATLAAKQRARAAAIDLEKTRADTLRDAADRYYELLGAASSAKVIREDIDVMERYASQLEAAVAIGTAFRGDLLRVRTQLFRQRLLFRQAEEALGSAAARLAETLRLAPESDLRPAHADLVPTAVGLAEPLPQLITKACLQRPELQSLDATRAAAQKEELRARAGVWIPSFQAGYSLGGLGGGRGAHTGQFGEGQDYFLGFGWKIGPGGIGDNAREKGAEARVEMVRAQRERVKAMIGREVAEATLRSTSCRDQIKMAEGAMAAADEMSRLAMERQASQVGVVLEFVLAREELTKARLLWVRAVTDFNRAEQLLRWTLGESASPKKQSPKH